MNDPHFVGFPSNVVDRRGRRVRIGTRITFLLAGAVRAGEVIAWGGSERGLEVDLAAEPFSVAVQPRAVDVVDEPHPSPISIGWRVVEDDDRPIMLLVPLGRRDLQIASRLHSSPHGMAVEPPGRGPRGEVLLRQWAEDIRTLMHQTSESPAQLMARAFDMPMLRRVLDEAMLPESIDRLTFIATDQDHPQHGDTIDLVPLATLWLEGRGHLGHLESMERPILEIAQPIIITRQPHLLDAVFYQIVEEIRARAGGCERVVCVLAGGTPGMKFGTILAASSVFSQQNVRIVQVPQAYEVDEVFVEQPLIEFDLSETVLRKPIDPQHR